MFGEGTVVGVIGIGYDIISTTNASSALWRIAVNTIVAQFLLNYFLVVFSLLVLGRCRKIKVETINIRVMFIAIMKHLPTP